MPKKTSKQKKPAGGSRVETKRTALSFAVSSLADFSAVDDWIEIGRTGTFTAKDGTDVTFSESDLDSIVNNADESNPAPYVIGHPKENAPAYGWTSNLKREGTSLFAKADSVVSEFRDWVDKKLYRKRSMSITPDGSGGYRLIHVGFLGAVPPAIPGMQDLQYANGDDLIELEFSESDAVHEASWYFDSITRILRGFRDHLIEKEGVDAADTIIPGHTLDHLAGAGDAIRAQLSSDDTPNLFSSPEDDPMPDPTKPAELTAAEAEIATLKQKLADKEKDDLRKDQERAFSARKEKATAVIEAKVKDNGLLPRNVPGLAEFCAALPDEKETAFEFSVGDGDSKDTKSKTPFDFAMDLLKGLGPQIKTGRDDRPGPDDQSHSFSSPAGDAAVDEDRAKLDRQALEYSQKNDVTYEQAVNVILGGA